MSISTGSTLGNTVLTNLTSTTQGDIKAVQSGAGMALDQAENRMMELASIGDSQEKLKEFAERTGIAAKNQDGSYSHTGMITILEGMVNKASRAFMTAQKIGDRMHEMMMEVIKSIGR